MIVVIVLIIVLCVISRAMNGAFKTGMQARHEQSERSKPYQDWNVGANKMRQWGLREDDEFIEHSKSLH